VCHKKNTLLCLGAIQWHKLKACRQSPLVIVARAHDVKILELSSKFYGVMEAVEEALKQTLRASSMVENLNLQLRNDCFLRRSLSDSYLGLL